jgi:5,5'-dehydrodivanillate O-demethylase oxygenase subunit
MCRAELHRDPVSPAPPQPHKIDDENTLSITWTLSRVPKEREPYVQDRIPTWQGPIADENTGRWITSHVMNQDFVTWVGQGRIADRSREYLGPSDSGIVMVRGRFLRDLDAISRGEDPKAVIRDPARNRSIRLPVADRRPLTDGLTPAEILRDLLTRRGLEGYIFQTGQPPEVRDAFLAAMGFNGAEFARLTISSTRSPPHRVERKRRSTSA